MCVMRVKVVVHEAEEGGFWAEVPTLPGCVSQGDSMDEWLANIGEAVQAWLEAEAPAEGGSDRSGRGRVVELTL
jgi:predicted RNase H-like HicB family nuclease